MSCDSIRVERGGFKRAFRLCRGSCLGSCFEDAMIR